MNSKEIFQMIEDNQNSQQREKWEKAGNTLKGFGIGITQLRKMAKKVGKNKSLATELWASDCYEARMISILIEDPKTLPRSQVEEQVEHLQEGFLEHVFSTCGAPLGKTSYALELIDDWAQSSSQVRERCAYALIYEIAKSKKKNAPDDEFFLNYLRLIESRYQNADKQLLLSMGMAIQGIGTRNRSLHGPALALARKIGPIDFNEEGQKCDPYDVEKHLTAKYVLEKFDRKNDS